MARTIAAIQAEIETEKASKPELNGLTSASTTAIWRLWIFVIATCIYYLEVLMDKLKVEITDIAARGAYGSPTWWQHQMLIFQYDATTPQVIQLIDYVPTYATVDEDMRIITCCSVKQQSDRRVKIKLAKGAVGSLEKLDTSELNAANDYINEIQPSGVDIEGISLDPDRLKVVADVYYSGQYVDTVVKAAVIAAITSYLSALDFDGMVSIQRLEAAILDVDGVRDVVLETVIARDAQTLISSAGIVNLVSAFTTNSRNYETVAGYIIPEDTAGHELDDTITMILP